MAKVRLETIDVVGERLFGKSVAVVGNAPELLDQRHGPAIEGHDVVIRMNMGVPDLSVPRLRKALGARTDILTIGKLSLLWPALRRSHPTELWHMKLTRSGDKDWHDLLEALRADRLPEGVGHRSKWRLFRYPQDQEERVHEKVGSPPSTGIRVLDLLQQWAYPKRVGVFGCNWFGAAGGSAKSWWDMKKSPATAHVGRLEYETFRKMGFQQVSPGHFECRKWRRSRPPSFDDRPSG